MLIRKVVSLFFVLHISFSILGAETIFSSKFSGTDTSNSVQKLTTEINAFYYSNHQKQLHALLMNHIFSLDPALETQKSREEITFYYIKTLLNLGLVHEASQFIDSLNIFVGFKESWKSYFWEAMVDYFLNNYNESERKFDIAIQKIRLSPKVSDNELAQVYFYKGLLLQQQKRREEALQCYRNAYDKIESNYFISKELNRRMSSIFSVKKEHNQALIFINNALLLTVSNYQFSSPYTIPPFENVKDYDAFADILQSRAFTFREMAKGNSDSLFYLNLSLRDAEASVIAFEKHKRSLVFESDLIYSNNIHTNIYSKTIEAIARVYEVTHADSLLHKALRYAEMDKVSALLYTIQRNKALYHSGIPADKIERLELMNKKLSHVEAKRYEAQANIRINDTALLALNLELYQLVTSITLFERELESNYPVYKHTKYQVSVPGLDKLLNVSEQRTVLEYVVSNEKLYTFLLVDGKLHFSHSYFGPGFIPAIETLQKMISNGSQIQFTAEEQKEFVRVAHLLYQNLIAPHKSLLSNKSLLVIPDGQLSLIPFEVLVTSDTLPAKVNYNVLPYLVKTNDISYAYSLTFDQQQSGISQMNTENKVFAVAPGYEKLAGNPGNQYLALRDARDNLGLLKGAEQEVKMVGKKLAGDILLDKKASEAAFKQSAGSYRVLHLAMHTLVNNEEPLYSKLVFTPDVDKTEDGLLNTYELMEMNLGADMVVLSACNTGFGKLNSGEGIVGLSRGFFQAGCKSLLSTLWSVSDKTSLQIMDWFYNGMEHANEKSVSLSQAKRKYLTEVKGMLAHPFFWAGFIVVGDDSALEIEASKTWWQTLFGISLMGLLILSVVFFLWKRKVFSRVH